MDIGSAFTFMFDDDEWIKKIAIGGGITFLGLLLSPILIGLALLLPLSGYMLETLKNVRDGRPVPLPEWSDFGNLFSKGLIVFLIGLVYSLPALIFYCISLGAQFGLQEADSDVANMLGVVIGCLACVQILFGLLAGFLLPAGLIRYAHYDTFGSAFQFGEIFSFIKENIGDYIIVILLSWVAQFVASFGLILCLIGILFTGFWGILVTANLYGQLARKAGASV
jgi:hypothetical protein